MKTKTGFTLKELLGVITIITVLAAILFPVFAKAIEGEKAKHAQCISNMKQLGQAFIQYREDNNNTYAPLYYNHGTDGYAYWNQMIAPYLKNSQILGCPSDSVTLLSGRHPSDIYPDGIICKLTNGTYTTQTSSYTYNQNICANSKYSNKPLTDSQITNPSAIFLNWDGFFSFYHLMTSYMAYPEPTGYDRMRTYKTNDWQWSRHTYGDNYSFCDGHVKWIKRSVAVSDNRTGAVNNPALNDPGWGDNL